MAARARRLWPLGTALLLGALWLAYALDLRSRANVGIDAEALPGRWVLDGSAPRVWHWVSHAFVHASAAHLTGNTLTLGVSSALFERREGALRTWLAFVATSVGAAVGFHLGDDRDLYGASGAAAGMIVMASLAWATARDAPWWRRAGPALVAALYFARNEVAPAIGGRASAGWRVHLWGALTGAALGAAMAWRAQAKRG